MQITLINGYYIDVDDLNYTLKQEYVGKDKDGNSKVSTRVIGYYGKLEHAVDSFLKRNQTSVLGQKSVSMKEYVKSIEQINKDAVRAITSVWERIGV
jgi:hypothetical protein